MVTKNTRARPDFSDQTGFFDPNQNGYDVTVIGCGGIGASALPTLVTMGFQSFKIWDPDAVEPRNMASQLAFAPAHLYHPKVDVMKEFLEAYGATAVETHQELFTAEMADQLSGIVIAAVDSMAARKMLFEAISLNPNVALFVDGRIGGEFWQLLTISPHDSAQLDWYEKWQLFDDTDAATLPCAERAVVYPAVALGATMACQLAKFVRGEELPRNISQHMRTLALTVQK